MPSANEPASDLDASNIQEATSFSFDKIVNDESRSPAWSEQNFDSFEQEYPSLSKQHASVAQSSQSDQNQIDSTLVFSDSSKDLYQKFSPLHKNSCNSNNICSQLDLVTKSSDQPVTLPGVNSILAQTNVHSSILNSQRIPNQSLREKRQAEIHESIEALNHSRRKLNEDLNIQQKSRIQPEIALRSLISKFGNSQNIFSVEKSELRLNDVNLAQTPFPTTCILSAAAALGMHADDDCFKTTRGQTSPGIAALNLFALEKGMQDSLDYSIKFPQANKYQKYSVQAEPKTEMNEHTLLADQMMPEKMPGSASGTLASKLSSASSTSSTSSSNSIYKKSKINAKNSVRNPSYGLRSRGTVENDKMPRTRGNKDDYRYASFALDSQYYQEQNRYMDNKDSTLVERLLSRRYMNADGEGEDTLSDASSEDSHAESENNQFRAAPPQNVLDESKDLDIPQLMAKFKANYPIQQDYGTFDVEQACSGEPHMYFLKTHNQVQGKNLRKRSCNDISAIQISEQGQLFVAFDAHNAYCEFDNLTYPIKCGILLNIESMLNSGRTLSERVLKITPYMLLNTMKKGPGSAKKQAGTRHRVRQQRSGLSPPPSPDYTRLPASTYNRYQMTREEANQSELIDDLELRVAKVAEPSLHTIEWLQCMGNEFMSKLKRSMIGISDEFNKMYAYSIAVQAENKRIQESQGVLEMQIELDKYKKMVEALEKQCQVLQDQVKEKNAVIEALQDKSSQ